MKGKTQHHGQIFYNSERHLKELVKAIEKINLQDKKILDVGAGTGWSGIELEKKGGIVVMIDLKPIGAKVIKMDAQKLDFLEKSFDVVNCHGCLHHIIKPSNAVKEFSRVLKENGLFILTGEPVLGGSWLKVMINRYFYQYLYLLIFDFEEFKAHGRGYLRREYDKWCNDAGLLKIDECGIYQKI